MDPEICVLNVAATDDSGFTYGEMVMKAVLRINGGNGVDIDDISDYIKERYVVPPNFRKQLRDKLKKLVSGNKLVKIDNLYKIFDAAAANTTEDLPSTSTLEGLEEKMQKIVSAYELQEQRIMQMLVESGYEIFFNRDVTKEATKPTQTLNPEDSTEPKDLPSSSLVENPTQILNPEDSTVLQDLQSSSIVSEDLRKKFIDILAQEIALAEVLEFQGKKIMEVADILDQMVEVNHSNVLLAEELYKKCKEGKPVPLVKFNEDIFDACFIKIVP